MTPTDMSVLVEPLPGSRVGMTIEIPTSQVDAAYERALEKVARKIRIQGFRPGRAPRAIVEQRANPLALREEAADMVLPELVARALEDNAIDPIDRPQVSILELERGRPGRFDVKVSVLPAVKLPELSSLVVERPQTVVDEAMVNRELDRLRDREAEISPVERPAADGDVLVADLRVFIDGEERPEEAETGIDLTISSDLDPKLVEALRGAVAEQTVAAELDMPTDHSNPELQGKLARFEVTVRGVKEKRVPELTDELAKRLSEGKQETVAALSEELRQDLERHFEHSDRQAFEQAALKALVEGAELEIPEALVDREVEERWSRLEASLQRRGIRLDKYLSLSNQTETGLREDIRPQASLQVKTELILDALGSELSVEPTPDEIREYMKELLTTDSEPDEKLLESERVAAFFRQRLIRSQVLETLLEKVAETAAQPEKRSEEEAPAATTTSASAIDEGA
jgi:trigger factor